MPVMKVVGTKTANSTRAMAIIAAPTSSIDSRAASIGVDPSFKRRSTFSTTTMASSTTMPTDRTRPNSVSMLSVKPNPCITTQVPIRDTGMATTGMMVARQVLRKRSTTRTTRTVASIMLQ